MPSFCQPKTVIKLWLFGSVSGVNKLPEENKLPVAAPGFDLGGGLCQGRGGVRNPLKELTVKRYVIC